MKDVNMRDHNYKGQSQHWTVRVTSEYKAEGRLGYFPRLSAVCSLTSLWSLSWEMVHRQRREGGSNNNNSNNSKNNNSSNNNSNSKNNNSNNKKVHITKMILHPPPSQTSQYYPLDPSGLVSVCQCSAFLDPTGQSAAWRWELSGYVEIETLVCYTG